MKVDSSIDGSYLSTIRFERNPVYSEDGTLSQIDWIVNLSY